MKIQNVEYFPQIDSTNSYAKRLLAECGPLRTPKGELTEVGKKYHNCVIIAESQTAGRGRLGRTFYSPSKTGVYLSIIYSPKKNITEPAKITAFSAVAICRVLSRLYNIKSQIKWINDIYLNNKKIAGILTEGISNFETSQIESVIIGIGINIYNNPDFFPSEMTNIIGSITNKNNTEVNTKISAKELALEIANEVINIFEENSQKLIKEYKNASFLLGTTINVHPIIGDEKKVYKAKAIDIDQNASLIVELEDGSIKTLNSGEVSLHQEN